MPHVWAIPRGRTKEELHQVMGAYKSPTAGHKGYLYEPLDADTDPSSYATLLLCAEAFDAYDGTRMPAYLLKQRLPEALRLVQEAGMANSASVQAIEADKESFRQFVAFCQEHENETGEPLFIDVFV